MSEVFLYLFKHCKGESLKDTESIKTVVNGNKWCLVWLLELKESGL